MKNVLVLLGMSVGVLTGLYVPLLWGASHMSMSGLVLALIGGSVGIWLSLRLTERI